MAKNTNKNFRLGAVKDRSQIFNQKTKLYVKRDTKTGKFISCKTTPYKGVSQENKSRIKK